MKFSYNEHLIYLHLAGSRAYGTDEEYSDYDYRGIIIPPVQYFYGFSNKFEQTSELAGYGEDAIGYDIRRFFELCAGNNPGVLESLYVRPEDRIITTKYSDKIIENRDLFLSKIIYKSYIGYADSQLHKLKNHRFFWEKEKDAASIPKEPIRANLGLSEKSRWSNSQLSALLSTDLKFLSADIHEELQREREFRDALGKYKQWGEWREGRNKTRYELEKKFGFDVKYAMHTVRLLKIAEEILAEGIIHVYRPDRQLLKNIRNGGWSYDKLIEWAEEQKLRINDAYSKTTLQELPQTEKIDNLCIEIVSDSLRVS